MTDKIFPVTGLFSETTAPIAPIPPKVEVQEPPLSITTCSPTEVQPHTGTFHYQRATVNFLTIGCGVTFTFDLLTSFS